MHLVCSQDKQEEEVVQTSEGKNLAHLPAAVIDSIWHLHSSDVYILYNTPNAYNRLFEHK